MTQFRLIVFYIIGALMCIGVVKLGILLVRAIKPLLCALEGGIV